MPGKAIYIFESCAEDGSYFEPFLPLLAHFARLMEAYQSYETEKEKYV